MGEGQQRKNMGVTNQEFCSWDVAITIKAFSHVSTKYISDVGTQRSPQQKMLLDSQVHMEGDNSSSILQHSRVIGWLWSLRYNCGYLHKAFIKQL